MMACSAKRMRKLGCAWRVEECLSPCKAWRIIIFYLRTMEYLDKREAISKMNALSADGVPFVFIVDYAMERSIVKPLHEVEPSEMMYCFGKKKNCNKAVAENNEPVEWSCEVPSKGEYRRKFDCVVNNCRLGNTYLANLTCCIPIKTNLSLRDIFCRSESIYKMWIKDSFVCFSPETFVRIDDGIIRSFPMKGTIEDAEGASEKLLGNAKESAEHATIVDLIRNDLSIVADNVSVKRYRYIDKIHTNRCRLLQTSSEIVGRLHEGWDSRIGDIMFSLLPAGSITGSPKPKTLQIINEAEGYRRGFYTGVMGIFEDGHLDSAVMIRFIDIEGGCMFFKAGGGITAKSCFESEYNEVIQKVYVPIH